MRRLVHIFVGVLLASGIALGAASRRHLPGPQPPRTRSATNPGHHRQDRSKNGSYNATVVGICRGAGTADVSDAEVSIRASVVDSSGQAGQFTAEHLATDGPYFSGTGTLFGNTVSVRGRLDAAKSSRLTATFFAPRGTAGRIIASLPSDQDPGDNHWDDDDDNGNNHSHTRAPDRTSGSN